MKTFKLNIPKRNDAPYKVYNLMTRYTKHYSYNKIHTIFECKELKNTVNDGHNDGNSKQVRICVQESLLQQTEKCKCKL